MMAWSKWLSGRSNLLSLNLSENDITDIGVNCICEHWKADSPLQELTLKSNKIGSNGALLLIRETTRHFAFCKLDISGNRTIGHRGLELIGQELPAIRFGALIINEVAAPITNSDAEAIQDAVGRALADGLRGNLSLVRLDIGSNRLGANGAHMLMQAVSVHPSLESLSLAHDRTIGLCGLKLIGMELPHTKLKKIDLDNCAWRYHWMQSSAATSAGQALLNGVWLNTTLTTFSFEGLPPMWNDPIQFFVQLNATCRPLLRSDAVVPAVWPYILEQFQRDAKLSQMYWSLRDQPWLVTTVPRR
jgi:Leucine-rich repeat (LRR) protein